MRSESPSFWKGLAREKLTDFKDKENIRKMCVNRPHKASFKNLFLFQWPYLDCQLPFGDSQGICSGHRVNEEIDLQCPRNPN
jgi:hypothetical protein